MQQNSRTKLTAFTDAIVDTSSVRDAATGKGASTMSSKKRKKQAEEPIYLTRI